MGGRIDIKPDHVAQLVDELRIVGELEMLHPVWLETMRVPDALDGTDANADRLGHHRGSPVCRLAWRIGARQSDDTLGEIRAEWCNARGARLVAQRPSKPASMNRSCQRHTQVFDFPVRRMISAVPMPSALSRTISARQTCLCGALRSRASAARRWRSLGLRVMEIPVRMR